ncbi:MAG: EAL domain-containing protein [Bradyrhizobium sp.]
MPAWVHDLPIRVKLFAANGFLFAFLLLVGANASVSLSRWSQNFDSLSGTVLPQQRWVMHGTNDLSAIQLKIFRFVAWSSNGVNPAVMRALRDEISGDIESLSFRLHTISSGWIPTESATAARLLSRWESYIKSVNDTLDVAAVDSPMGTMMLGGVDDDFERVARQLRDISEGTSRRTQTATAALLSDVEANKMLIAAGGIAALLLTIFITLVVIRSIAAPVRAITATMRQIAKGEAAAKLDRTARADEIGQMIGAISVFQENTARDTALIREREVELRLQNVRFDAALSNMSHGLAMYDSERRLIVCNRRYAEIYKMPLELLAPGTPHEEILRVRAAHGVFAGRDSQHYIDDCLEHARRGTPWVRDFELSDGRVIVVSYRPMANGGWVSIHEDVTERRRAEEQIKHMALHDALTDLPNRVLFKERLNNAFGMLRRGGKIAVLCLDLDHFKNVNDTLGHPIGDALLRSIGERLRSCVRDTDIIARLSGDEFAIIAPEDPENTVALARRIIDRISAPFEIDQHHVVVGTSIGIAFGPDDGADADGVLKSADTALYRAKMEGRGSFRFFEPDMDARLQARRAMEIDLRTALENDEFEIYYQPVVDLEKQKVTGFEALLRWHHKTRGMIPPADFIPLAEEIGLIVPIGDWVLRRACLEAAGWPENMRVAVNVSAVQFRGKGLVGSVINALATSGLAPDRLEIEITESVLLENSDATFLILRQLHAFGVRMSMDDFGTGYSSLSYLQKFPFNKIKIDQSFIRTLGNRSDSEAIVRAVVGLGRSLGMVITAEGVETEAQFAALKAEGCLEVQGYFFSAPQPAGQIRSMLADVRTKAA